MSSNDAERSCEIPLELAACEAEVAAVRARQLALVAELDRLVPAGYPDAAREEVAVACRVSDAEARRRLTTARALAGPAPALPATAAALAAGELSLAHAEAMTSATSDLDRAERHWVELQVLGDERARTPGQVGYRARKAALLVGAHTVDRRQAELPERTLTAWRHENRVDFILSVPSPDAALVTTYLDAAAVRQGCDDVRLAATRRADALLELVRGALDAGVLPSGGDGRRPHLEVIATHESLLDGVWRGGEVEGRSMFGAQLRELGCDADVRVTLTNDLGRILDQGRTTRVLSAALRGRLDVRDQHCRFPGCEVRARRCRAHHICHWADGGPTDLANLVLTCERHHHAIHDGGWDVALHGDAAVV